MNTLHHSQHTIRFRCWSRKGYAMFSSLGKCVTIGSLKKEIADSSLGKQNHVCTAFSACRFMWENETEREREEEEVGLFERVMLPVLQFQLSQPQGGDVVPHVDRIILIAERMCHTFFRLFFVLI